MEIEDLVGQKLVIGFSGTRISPGVIQQFKDTHAGGVIFYRINFESPDQLKKTIRDLEEALQRRLLVCVDHEGGRVVMFRDGVTIFPDNLCVGHTKDPQLAAQMGETAARELRALGTDVNFAPVLDVLTESYSPNIGIRSFGSDWKQAAGFGIAYIKALQKGGVSATAKHFPGKGHAPYDAHIQLPTILSTWEEMKALHLKPFEAAIRAGVDVIMSSHPYYPRLDPIPDNIATFSRRIITDCLRNELGFKGVISSDDLEMGAVKDVCPPDIAAVRAAAAGHDLILSCHDYQSETQVFRGLVEAYKGKVLPLNELEESVQRIQILKKKRTERFTGKVGPVPGGPELALKIAKQGVQVIQSGKPISQNNPAVLFPRLSEFASKIMIERGLENETAYLKSRIPGPHHAWIYPIQPELVDFEQVDSFLTGREEALLFLFDAHLFPGQKKLLENLQKQLPRLMVILLRDPYDRAFLRPQDTCVTAFGFRIVQLDAAIEKIFSLAK